MIRVFPRPKCTGGGQILFPENSKILVGGDAYPAGTFNGGDGGGGFHVCGGGWQKCVENYTIFLVSQKLNVNFRKKLGQMLRDLVNFLKMGENIQIFLENSEKNQNFLQK